MNWQKQPVSGQGFSLIELTIATAIFSMGLGGLSLMLMMAVRGTTFADHYSLATVHANSLAEMILINSDAVGHYINPPASQATGCLGGDQLCSSGEIGGTFMHEWQHQLGTDLPNGNGLVCMDGTPHDGSRYEPLCDGSGNAVIKVFWQSPPGNAGGDPMEERLVRRLPIP